MRKPVVQLEDFTLLREGIPLFNPLSLTIDAGQTISVLGENGVGKTTLLNQLAGLRRPGIQYRGRCSVLASATNKKAVESAWMGVMLIRQMPTSYKRLTVLDQVLLSTMKPYSLWASVSISVRKSRMDTRQRAMNALDEMGLANEAATLVEHLSLGQRRCLALASVRVRLESGHLQLLMLDEPMSGLDESRRLIFNQVLRDVAARGCATMVAEHLGISQSPLGETAITLQAYSGEAL